MRGVEDRVPAFAVEERHFAHVEFDLRPSSRDQVFEDARDRRRGEGIEIPREGDDARTRTGLTRSAIDSDRHAFDVHRSQLTTADCECHTQVATGCSSGGGMR